MSTKLDAVRLMGRSTAGTRYLGTNLPLPDH